MHDDLPENLIFLHMRKTGGVTIRQVLAPLFAGKSINKFINPTDSALGLKRLKHVQNVVKDTLPHTSPPRLIIGHIPIGNHLDVPDYKYITLVCSPRDRVISSYYYLKDIDTLPISPILKKLPLDGYVAAHYGLDPHDYQTRILSGSPELDACLTGEPITNYRDVQEHDYAQAIQNLDEHFMFVEITEYIDETLLMLKRIYGWRLVNLLYQRQNVGASRPRVDNIPAEVLHIIDEQNPFDRKLYDECLRRFRALVKHQGIFFQLETTLFKMINRLARQGGRKQKLAMRMCYWVDWFDTHARSANNAKAAL